MIICILNCRANDERYAEHFAWSQLIPRLHGSSVDNLQVNDAGESEIMDGVVAKNSFPATVKGNAAQLPRGRNVGQSTVYPAEGSEFQVGSYRTQRMVKRYKLSFYDCIALYCQEERGDSRNSCILNSCNRSRSWPRN